MLNMNRVTLLGHAGRDPEVRTIKSGEKTATFSLATTEKWRRKDGGTGEATEWHRIVVFGAAVEAVAKLVRKGAALLIEGRITTREYQDKKGDKPPGYGNRRRGTARPRQRAVAAPGRPPRGRRGRQWARRRKPGSRRDHRRARANRGADDGSGRPFRVRRQ